MISTNAYSQPALPTSANWSVKSVDTQVISKHWPKLTQGVIREQVKLVADLGVNYIAVDTPYDKPGDLKMWADEIHRLGLHVWFRSHWDEWEGDNGKPDTMTPDEYLSRTSKFIRNNPTLFQPGDSFTLAVEPEQVGVGLGERFLTWDQYRGFILSEVLVSNQAFQKIGLDKKIYTNWISVNGWIVENEFNQDLVDKLGLITVDHYVGQSNTIGQLENPDEIVSQTVGDLDRFYGKWKKPILLGEWGYQIYQPVSEEQQALVIDKMFRALQTKNYLIGVNYWVHMGNTASIIGDQYGANLTYRKGANVIKSYYDPAGPKLENPNSTIAPTPTPRAAKTR